jgi:hypothetical protein
MLDCQVWLTSSLTARGALLSGLLERPLKLGAKEVTTFSTH